MLLFYYGTVSNSRRHVFNNRISMKKGKVTEGVRLPDQQSYMAKKRRGFVFFFRANQSRMTSLLVSALIFFQSFVSILLIFAGVVAGRVMRF